MRMPCGPHKLLPHHVLACIHLAALVSGLSRDLGRLHVQSLANRPVHSAAQECSLQRTAVHA